MSSIEFWVVFVVVVVAVGNCVTLLYKHQ